MTKSADQKWKDLVVSLGCVAGSCGRPACLHHPRYGQGLSQRANDRLAIPLCPCHHQHGGHGVALHAGQKAFEEKYGTEIELLEKVYAMLGEEWPPTELAQLIANQKFGSRLLFRR